MKILIVEDEEVIGRSLQRGLEEVGHECIWLREGPASLALAASPSVDLLVLDLMLPGVSGWEVLRTIRRQGLSVPVIVVSALGSLEERVAGLEAGADDYLVKPFAFPELLARIAAVTRRTTGLASPVCRIGPLSLDRIARQASRDGKEIELTPTEYALLDMLMRHAGRVVTRKMLCEHLWEADWEGVTNVIEVHINRLRAKIDRDFDPPLLQTVRGQGYSLRLPDHADEVAQ